MKINFDTPILGVNGVPVKIKEDDAERGYTLRDVCITAVLAETDKQKPLDGAEKVKRLRLADRIFGCKEPISITAEEIVMLKDQIAKTFSVLFTGRAWAILDAEEPTPPAAPADPAK